MSGRIPALLLIRWERLRALYDYMVKYLRIYIMYYKYLHYSYNLVEEVKYIVLWLTSPAKLRGFCNEFILFDHIFYVIKKPWPNVTNLMQHVVKSP